MPAPYPAEFKRRAVELATQPDAKVVEVARDLGIAELRRAAAHVLDQAEHVLLAVGDGRRLGHHTTSRSRAKRP